MSYPAHVQEKIDAALRAMPHSLLGAAALAQLVQRPELLATANRALLAPKMNLLERRYAAHLDVRKFNGEVAWWRFNAIRFRLGRSWYKPDFLVINIVGLELEVHETKGFWREAARVRIKTAADLYPLRFVAVTEDDDGWHFESFGATA